MKKQTDNEVSFLKQVIFKMENDRDDGQYRENVANLNFLKEMKDRFEKGKQDITQYEYGMQMISDWMVEIKKNIVDYKERNYL